VPNDAGEYHRIGSHVMKRIAPAKTRGRSLNSRHSLAMRCDDATHAHLSSHAAVLVMRGEIEFELGASAGR
jgi:hypothetical protein